MKINYFVLKENQLTPVKDDLKPKDWVGNVSWIDIRSENRPKVADYFEDHDLLKYGRDFIEHPENHTQPKIIRDKRAFNIVISNNKNIYRPDYITVVLTEKLIVTIMPEGTDILHYRNIIAGSEITHGIFLYLFFYRMITDILTQNRYNLIKARGLIHQTEDNLAESSEYIKPSQVMKLKHDIGQLADIIEDQHITFDILTSLSVNVHYVDNINKIKELITGFEPLSKILLRLEEKAESIHSYFMLIQQDKATRKINVLTIIQVIFVPLTFIAGVYGMNFLIMPELHWKYGYFITLFSFFIIAAVSLYFFYKKGWFD